ncbi:Clp protease ClpP [Aminipila butyrica]|uniref:ATP-dependent Clp protease proteolytic subunit n=1 Tax=Aminipila butyrica TaxID=433296 RepID=A0A858BTU2_9FIRM|nr:head maturation protease, ClpP-related [Aminipila butyrica]QIB68609.1 Clp protease ClpP [Aminipila butyrica]
MPEKNKKYWEFKAKVQDEADLYLYIEIASWGAGYAAHSAQSFKRELDALGEIKTLNVYINSPGGDVFEGNAIYNILSRKAKKCAVNVYVDGLAASIASVIAMAGTKIIMPNNAMMMIHNAWCVTWGNSGELREAAEMLDKVNLTIRQAYLNKAGDVLEQDALITLMDEESWLTAQECLDYGLCDEVIGEKQVAAKFDPALLKNFKNAPTEFFTLRPDGAREDPEDKRHEPAEKPAAQLDHAAEKERLLLEIDFT